MNHVGRLGDAFEVPISPDEDGFFGRECPSPDCEGYFRILLGTGLTGENLPCHCPYCGHIASHSEFATKEQLEYAQSVVVREVLAAAQKDLKKLEFEHRPRGTLGIGLSLKVKTGRSVPIHYYREQKLETEVVCGNCGLRYSVYGVFAFCPDCGQHNSLQIIEKDLEMVGKILALAAEQEKELAEHLVESALEDCVSVFDGFGRELCKVNREHSVDPARVERVSFQNLEGARSAVAGLFDVDLAAYLALGEWQSAVRGFQKRHLIAHRMGVIDQDYITKTGDNNAVIGRRVRVTPDEVMELVHTLSKVARGLSADLQETAKT